MQVGFFLKPPVCILLAWGGGIHIENGFWGSGKTLRDLLEALPCEWLSEDLLEALSFKGIQLSPTK
jgi:hypothetical protein